MEPLLVVAVMLGSLVAIYVAHQSVVGGGPPARRAFRRQPATTVAAAAAAAPGVHRLAGTARPVGAPPASEASGRPWVARELRIAAGAGDGGVSTRGAGQAVDFLLDDGSGVALVRAADARVSLPRDVKLPRTTLDRVPWVDELLRAGGYRNGSPETCTIRLWEGVLAPGGRAGVVGWVEPADDAARALGATVVVRAPDDGELVIRAERGAAPQARRARGSRAAG